MKATVISNEQVIPVDIDGTLIIWGKVRRGDKALHYTCPYTSQQMTVRVHQPNVAILKERLARGATILAWSASGFAKAQAVLAALKIDSPNLIILSKPVGYMDDIECSEWMGKRIFLDEDCKYGA